MAELALGAISLGIQVCQGIAVYIGALNSRDEDLSAIRSQTQALEGIFRSIETHLQRHGSLTAAQTSLDDIARCLRSCQTELKVLDDLGNELLGRPLSSSSALSFRDKLKEETRRLKYPFRKPEAERLLEQLRRVTDTLQLAIQVFSISQSRVEQHAATAGSELTCIRSELSALHGPFSGMKSQLSGLQNESVAHVAELRSINTNLVNINAELRQDIGQITQVLQTITLAEAEAKRDRAAILQLVAKPELLRNLCDQATQSAETTPASRHDGQPVRRQTPGMAFCTCPQKRTRKLHRSSYGPFHFYKISSAFRHSVHCPVSSLGLAEEQQTWGCVLASVPALFIRKAVEVSYCMTAGAGGFSISPRFTYYCTVNATKSPVFRTIRTLMQSMSVRRPTQYRGDEHFQWCRLLHVAMNKIIQSYRDKTASPFDVDDRNCSALHVLAEMTAEIRIEFNQSLETASHIAELTQCLVAYGVPLDLCDIDGQQAIHKFLIKSHAIFLSSPLEVFITNFAPDGMEIHLLPTIKDPDELGNSSFDFDKVRAFTKWPDLAEGFYGPLTAAVLRNDKQRVEHLIEIDASLLQERSYHGQTPFHMAVLHPTCLKLLVDKVDKSSTGLLSQTDNNGVSILEFALFSSQILCKATNGQAEPPCDCTLSVKILLDGGCPLQASMTSMKRNTWFTTPCSIHCEILIARRLKQDREELRKLALARLLPSDLEALDLYRPGTLDIRAFPVYQALIERGVLVPPSLAVYYRCKLNGLCHHSHPSKSVYYGLDLVESAMVFKHLGFDDAITSSGISLEDQANCIDANDAESCPFTGYGSLNLAYARWLLEHGLHLWYWVPCYLRHRMQGDTNAFLAARLVGDFFSIPGTINHSGDNDFRVEERVAARWLLENCALLGEMDTCMCLCSVGGCMPFILLLGEALGHKGAGKANNPEEWVDFIAGETSTILEFLGDLTHIQHQQATVRWCTVMALRLRHTCCNFWDDGYTRVHEPMLPDDAAEILEEQRDMIVILDTLLGEFELAAGLKADCKPDHARLIGFMKGYWSSTMKEQIGSMNRTNSDRWGKEKEAAEDIGVVWEIDDPEGTIEEKTWEGYEYWAARINEIE
ncbi:hypothetical protein S7711_06520 [Stachybotrys chartarum IBT 7711]|uniref:Uncharacterized protein n=1 Tax=Stachybotrys chartarum (strain CBS 109288 / IBT 7711) TaxID=1280523 RepID=A0A084BBA5_STACB|nr:hypothetical protein S7711_06520 [Stachybotrys chartarum IBT 7711]